MKTCSRGTGLSAGSGETGASALWKNCAIKRKIASDHANRRKLSMRSDIIQKTENIERKEGTSSGVNYERKNKRDIYNGSTESREG